VKQVVHVGLVSTSSPPPPPSPNKKRNILRAYKNVWFAGFSISALKIGAILQIKEAALQIEIIFYSFKKFVNHPLQQTHSYKRKRKIKNTKL